MLKYKLFELFYLQIPAFVFHGIVPCVAITSSAYFHGSKEYFFISGCLSPTDKSKGLALRRCGEPKQRVGSFVSIAQARRYEERKKNINSKRE
jgi:hypothetical protein